MTADLRLSATPALRFFSGNLLHITPVRHGNGSPALLHVGWDEDGILAV
jgi:hypothetical protein